MANGQRFFILVPAIVLAFTSIASAQNDRARINASLSPDGSTKLFVTTEDGDAEIYTERPDGSQLRKLTNNDTIDNYPSWSPDGKNIVFTSDRSGQFQIHVMDADGQNVRQLTKEKQGATLARYGPDGQIAYLASRGREYKRRFSDLILIDGEASKTIATRKWITDFAWSPDGTLIVYGRTGDIVFHNLKTDAKTVVPHTAIDKRLDSHFVWNIRWRDNLSITCQILFAGGVVDDGKGGPKIFGDDEEFIIDRDGKSSWRLIK